MVTLRRTVRFSINLDADGLPVDSGPSYNGYGGHPSPIGLGRYFEIELACRGTPDPRTGYLVNIKDIDGAVRRGAIPVLRAACAAAPGGLELVGMLPVLAAAIQEHLEISWSRLVLRLSPYHAVEMATDAPSIALLRTSLDFAASHRLNCAEMTPAQNRAVFGKCNNPSGHGHNYRIEPCVAVELNSLAASPFTVQMLERATDETIIERFDHKHLNLDTVEFADEGGVNPSVENIARVCFALLEPVIRGVSGAAALRSVTVWETDRTCATYPA